MVEVTTGPEDDELPEVEEEQDDTTDETEADEPQDEESDEDEEDIEPDPIEVEYGGKKYKVHPDLRDGIMWQADYTRKTQEVAEQRKALEARITETEQVSEAETNLRVRKVAIEAALEQYSNADWDALERQNPAEAQRHFRNFTVLQQQLKGTESDLREASGKREAETKQVFAERFEQSMSEIGKAIPDWGEPKAVALRDFAQKNFGFTDEEFRIALHDPRQIKLVNMAFAAAKAKPKPASPQPAVKAASKVKGGSSPKKGLDDRMSAEEWTKARNRQLQTS
jgi:hypothetical protein